MGVINKRSREWLAEQWWRLSKKLLIKFLFWSRVSFIERETDKMKSILLLGLVKSEIKIKWLTEGWQIEQIDFFKIRMLREYRVAYRLLSSVN